MVLRYLVRTCDDGDPLTGNDVYQPDCSCAGDLIDCLGVPGGPALPGTTCDDGDPLTGNDVYQGDCSCAGDLIDCLGVPGGPALPGTTCDDGDPLTGNDIYQGDCSCSGVPVDCLGVPGGPALPGTTCDDGDPLTGNDVYQGDCSCAGDLIDCLGVPGGPALPGTTCDDGDPLTGNDVYQGDCSCAGDLIDCLGVPGGPALPGTTCDDGDPLTGNDVYQGDCSCAGDLIDCLGVPGGPDLPGTTCDDGDPLTGNDIYQGDCSCAGVPVDCLGVPGGPALPGTTCDDGDPLTGNDIYQGDCSCAGDLIDCLGVPGGPALPGTTCDDGDPNTENDVYQGDCSCAGTPIGGCSYEIVDFNDFESGWGIWNDGGSDCRRSSNDAAFANSGTYCVRLRDNTSTSVMTTDNMDLSSHDEIRVDFNYITTSMDNSNEDFWLQISLNGGASFSTVEEWNEGDEFQNNVREFDVVTISGPFSTNTQLRFRCDASNNGDRVYIDDVLIEGCLLPSLTILHTLEAITDQSEILQFNPVESRAIHVYPNPTRNWFVIELNDLEGEIQQTEVYGLDGRLIQLEIVQSSNQKQAINLGNVMNGIYIVRVLTVTGEQYFTRVIKQ